MPQLTPKAQHIIDDLAQRYGVSTDAVTTLLQALVNGYGTMAQFNHPELGGSGQWIKGGMTMVGDMFNNALKTKVDGLCLELSTLLANQPLPAKAMSSQSQQGQWHNQSEAGGRAIDVSPADSGLGHWWPADLGIPNTVGAQNSTRYAYFASARRLVVESNGHITVYDTLDHRITGVSQQQSGSAALTFTSQHGPVDITRLPVVAVDAVVQRGAVAPAHTHSPDSHQDMDVFTKLEKLAELRQKGILSEEEFSAKKAELLSKL